MCRVPLTGSGSAYEKRWKILRLSPKFTPLNPLQIAYRIVENAKNFSSKVLGDRERHVSETLHEKIDRLFTIQIKCVASSMRSVLPWVAMVEPGSKFSTEWISRVNLHIDQQHKATKCLQHGVCISG
jgi:hypothetical protein